MNKIDDKEFQEYAIEKVEEHENGYTITFDGCVCFGVDKECGITPKVGDIARFYGAGLGFAVRGLDINDKEVFYRTPEQQKEKHREEQAQRKKEQAEEFRKNRIDHDRRIALLPDVFKARFADFYQRGALSWRVEYEAYELFVCEEAVMLADKLNTVKAVEEFSKLDYKSQKEKIPAISDNHSGNTFGQSLNLAHAYLQDPTVIPKMHGALCPMVGCQDYKCWSITQKA